MVNVQATVQFRSGRGRMSGSFNDAELAGIVFGMTAALNVWLVYLRKWGSAANLGKTLEMLEKFHIPGLVLLSYLFLTQSRGPMLAVAVAYLILQIPRFKNKNIASVIVAILIVSAAAGAYQYFSRYTNVADPGAMNEQQGSALYRRNMNELYQPIVAQGGMLGWGMLSHPVLPGMFSIDNEFLLVHLAYGTCGYILFLLIAAESFRRLIVLSWKIKSREDQAFAFILIGTITICWISFATVYMGEQLPQIVFLLIGWGQSVQPRSTTPMVAVKDGASPKFAFKRVFS
ncbi:MAG: O-antigen ligase family protein [Terracidiphilus sp.]